MVVASVSGMNLSPSFSLVQVWRMAVLVFAVVLVLGLRSCRDLRVPIRNPPPGARRRPLEVERGEFGAQRLGVGQLFVDAGEAQVGDAVGVAQALEAELADPARRELAVRAAAASSSTTSAIGSTAASASGSLWAERSSPARSLAASNSSRLPSRLRTIASAGAETLEGGEAMAAGTALAAAAHGGSIVGGPALDDPGSVVTKRTNQGWAKVLGVADGKVLPLHMGSMPEIRLNTRSTELRLAPHGSGRGETLNESDSQWGGREQGSFQGTAGNGALVG